MTDSTADGATTVVAGSVPTRTEYVDKDGRSVDELKEEIENLRSQLQKAIDIINQRDAEDMAVTRTEIVKCTKHWPVPIVEDEIMDFSYDELVELHALVKRAPPPVVKNDDEFVKRTRFRGARRFPLHRDEDEGPYNTKEHVFSFSEG